MQSASQNCHTEQFQAEMVGADLTGDSVGWGTNELVAMLDAAGAGIWGLDLRGRCAFINEAACRMLGYSREECVGQDMHDKVHSRFADGSVCPRKECPVLCALHSGTGIHVDGHVLWRSDGTPLAVEFFAQPIVVNGRLRGLVVCSFEIGRRKRAEDALRASEERFRMAFENALIGIGIVGLDGRYSKANQTLCQITGYTEQELLQADFDAITHPDDREESRQLQRAFNAGEVSSGVLAKRYIRKDGQPVWVSVSVSLVRDPDGKPLHFITLVNDISKQKKAEEERRQFELMSEHSRDPILYVRRDDRRILGANAAATKAYGYTHDELLELTIHDLRGPAVQGLSAGQLAEADAHGILFETVHRRKDGSTFPVEVSLQVATISGTRFSISVVRDISERKRVEEALLRSEEWLRLAQDAAGVGIWDWDAATREIKVSDQQFRLYGLDPATEFPLHEEFLRLIHPADRDRLARELDRAMAGESNYESHFRVVWPDASVHWLFARGRSYLSENGEMMRFIGVNVDVTDRMLSESALQQFFSVSDSKLAVIGFDGYIKRANPALLKATGYTIEELQCKPFDGFLHPDDAPVMQAEFARICGLGGSTQGEFRGLCKDRSQLWFLFVSTAVKDEQLVYTAAHDITEQKRAAAALAVEVIQRRVLFEQSRDGIVVFDPSGKTIEANQSFARMLGYSAEEMRQLHVWDYDDSMTRDQILEKMDDLRSASATFETRHRRKDGSLVEAEVSSAAIELGAEVVYYAVVRDITDRKRAEKALRESEWRFKLIAETIDDVFWMTDMSIGEMIYISPGYERMWGRTLESLYKAPRSFLDIVHPDDMGSMRAHMERMKSALPLDHEYRIVRPDGSIAWIWNRGFPVRGATGDVQYYVGVGKDITDRKSLEEGTKRNAEKLARSNAELERFAYVASHDLQEPLRMVASYTQLLAKRYSGQLDERADRYIHYAVDGATRMQQLIRDLLTYSRVNSKALDLRLTDCETVVAGSLENLKAAIKESGASVTWDPLPTFMADPMQLSQLFQNLLGNAIKFKRELPPHVHISAVDGGAEWLFSVRDNGIGIDRRHADGLFQVFHRLHTREEYPGTGIGLALCKTVVGRHGGKIWVESEVGVGSDFRFTLPKQVQNGGILERIQ